MGFTGIQSVGEQLIASADIHRLRGELDQIRNIPYAARERRRNAKAEVDLLERSVLAMTKDDLRVEEAILVMDVDQAVDEKTGKAKFSNETVRKAALAVAMKNSQTYQKALAKVRDAEERLAKLNGKVQEAEDDVKANAELVWTLRSLLDAARAEVMAICTFDAQLMPTEIPITLPADALKVQVQVQMLAPTGPIVATIVQGAPLEIAPLTLSKEAA